MDYVKILNEDGTTNRNMVLREDGSELRRAPAPEWAVYEAFVAAGGITLDTVSAAKWAKLNALARRRSPQGRPPGAEIPLPPAPPQEPVIFEPAARPRPQPVP